MSVSVKSPPVGRRPVHSTLNFEDETNSAVVQQLHRAEFVASRKLVSGRTVLDVGCGSGYTCHYFVQRGGAVQAVGLDVDQALISLNHLANEDERVEFIYKEPDHRLPFADNSLECVTCFEVLEHLRIHVQRRLVREAARVVCEDGVCVFSTPHQPVYSPDGTSRNPDHIRELDAEEFEDLIGESFGSVELFGQKFSDAAKLAAFQRSHFLSHHPLIRCLQWATRGVPVKLMRGGRRKSPYRVAKRSYTITPGIDKSSLVMLAVCRDPLV